jgi:ketosteroid isomerase-like protein
LSAPQPFLDARRLSIAAGVAAVVAIGGTIGWWRMHQSPAADQRAATTAAAPSIAAGASGLTLKADDSELLSALAQLRREAETRVERAQREAVLANAPVLVTDEYRAADARRQEAARLPAERPEAVRRFWESADLFEKAASRAKTARNAAPAARDDAAPKTAAKAPGAERRPASEQPTASTPAAAAPPAPAKPAVDPEAQRQALERQRLEAERLERERLEKETASKLAADRQAIEQLLNQYVAAYNALDASAVARLVPSVPSAQLQRTFAEYASFKLALTGIQLNLQGDTATVTGTRRIDVTVKRGNQTLHQENAAVFTLRRAGSAWTIESVK